MQVSRTPEDTFLVVADDVSAYVEVASIQDNVRHYVERVFHQRTINNLIASIGNRLESRGAPAFLWRRLKAR